ncbi:MAG: hypothetical protein ACD_12C00430G0002, partial [uncultured bacterium]
MKIAIATSNVNSFLVGELTKNFEISCVIFENRQHPYHFLPFYAKRFKKRPLTTVLELIYQFYKVLFIAKKTNKNIFSDKIYFYKTISINSEETEKKLKEISPDLLILDGTSVVKKNILVIPRVGTINIHLGINPLYRGGGNAWAFINKDYKNVGATIHLVTEKLDAGSIIKIIRMDVLPEMKSVEEYNKYCHKKAVEELVEIIKKIEKGQPQ